jgi:hypothetical protein
VPETITLKRDGDRSLVFDGTRLGEGSSRRHQAPRWFEVQIYRTASGRYVVAGAGKSVLPGEVDRCWAVECDEPREVVRALTRYDEDEVEYLTRTARDALEAAAAVDVGIRDAFLKRVA